MIMIDGTHSLRFAMVRVARRRPASAAFRAPLQSVRRFGWFTLFWPSKVAAAVRFNSMLIRSEVSRYLSVCSGNRGLVSGLMTSIVSSAVLVHSIVYCVFI